MGLCVVGKKGGKREGRGVGLYPASAWFGSSDEPDLLKPTLQRWALEQERRLRVGLLGCSEVSPQQTGGRRHLQRAGFGKQETGNGGGSGTWGNGMGRSVGVAVSTVDKYTQGHMLRILLSLFEYRL